jgi:hypothetical protein
VIPLPRIDTDAFERDALPHCSDAKRLYEEASPVRRAVIIQHSIRDAEIILEMKSLLDYARIGAEEESAGGGKTNLDLISLPQPTLS